ncbi:MAG: DUF5721 family protein [Dorea sp.]|nr:DUF5721 family protein [Dorea sp.]
MNVYTLSAKNCMSHLLLKETFDQFLFIEGEITTFNKFSIDGFLQSDFFDEPPKSTYSLWKNVREFCYNIIRGKRTPLNFKIVLSLPPASVPGFLARKGISGYHPEDIQGLYLNFHYDGSTLQCITGTSVRTFTLDKTLEREWDTYIGDFLKPLRIE